MSQNSIGASILEICEVWVLRIEFWGTVNLSFMGTVVIQWIVIYLPGSIIQSLINWGLMVSWSLLLKVMAQLWLKLLFLWQVNEHFVHSVICSMHPNCIDLLCLLQDNKVTGRKADVIQAAYLASELAQRLVKAGKEVRNLLIWTDKTINPKPY